MVRFGFFNIQSGVGVTKGYWQYALAAHKYLLPHDARVARAVAELADRSFDVLACAETEGPSVRGRGVDYPARIAELSSLAHQAFFPSNRVGRWIHQGTSVHARSSFTRSLAHALPGGLEPRVMGEVELVLEGRALSVFVAHLSLGKNARAAQLAHIAETVAARPSAVLMGDFNTADTDELRPLFDAGMQRAPTGPTHPAWRPSAALDHVLLTPDWRVESARVLGDVKLADHLPVLVHAHRD